MLFFRLEEISLAFVKYTFEPARTLADLYFQDGGRFYEKS